jgi:hypothetical protein
LEANFSFPPKGGKSQKRLKVELDESVREKKAIKIKMANDNENLRG